MNSRDKRFVYFYWSILKYFGLNPSEGLLALLIYGLSRKEGYCHASKKYLSNMMNVSEATIFSLINRLVRNGLIIKDGFSEYKTSCYKPSEKFSEYIKILKEVNTD